MNNLKLGLVFDVKNGRFKAEVKQNSQVIEKFGSSTQRTAGQTRQLSTSLAQTNVKLAATNKVAQAVGRAIAGMAAGFGALQFGSGLVKELAQFQDIRTRLQGLSIDAADYADKERWLIELAKAHHKELNGLADGYSRLSTLTQEKIITDNQARNMLEGLSNAAAQNGASTADLERVYYGLAQALGQGVVQMQEVNQVVEPLPGLMTKLARAAGEETGAGFKKLIASGKVTSEVFGGLLVKALQEYEGAAAKTANNINAKYRDIKREYQLLAVELEQPINSALMPTLNGLAEGLSFLKDHTEGVINVLEAGLVIAAGHAVNALTNKTAATIQSTLADRAKAQAALVAAKADITLAQSAVQRAIQEQAAAKRSLANASNTVLRTRAIKNLALANGQVATSEKALAATRATLTVVTNKLSLAQRSLGLMSSLVGGLPGLLTIAGFAMFSFATRTGEAADEAKRLNDENKKLNPFANYTFEAATGALLRYQGQLELAQQMAEETQTRFKNPFFKNVTAGDVVAANKEVEKLNQTIVALQSIVNGKASKSVKTPKQDSKALDVFAQQRDALRQQLALLGKSNELAKAEYATTQGKYKDLLPAQKTVLLNLAKEIDAKNKSITVDQLANNQAKQLSSSANSYAETLQRKIALTDESSNVAQLNFELEHGSLKGINDELRTHLELLAQKADATQTLAEQQLPFWEQMKEHISSTSQNFDAMWGNTFDNFAQGIGEATATAAMEGKSFGNTMKSIARGAVKEVISGLVQIGIKKLALAAIEKTIGVAGATAATATAATAGTTIALSMAPAAAMASLASFGANSAPAMMGIGATVALSQGLALAGMAHDGITEVPREGTWLLDKGERVVDSRTNADLKQALGNGTMGGSGDIHVHYAPKITTNGQEDFAEQLQAHADHIGNIVSEVKNDRMEDF